MRIEYKDYEGLAAAAINSILARGIPVIVTLTTGQVFNFIPTHMTGCSDTVVGFKADEDFEKLGEPFGILLREIEEVAC